MPPFFAIAIAILDSVTVSIADDNRWNLLKLRFSIKQFLCLPLKAKFLNNLGANVTSSNVKSFFYRTHNNFIYDSLKI